MPIIGYPKGGITPRGKPQGQAPGIAYSHAVNQQEEEEEEEVWAHEPQEDEEEEEEDDGEAEESQPL